MADLPLPDLELVAEKVHDNWMQMKIASGITSRKLDTSGEELLVPYKDLSEEAKDLDRGTVRTVYAAIKELAGGKS